LTNILNVLVATGNMEDIKAPHLGTIELVTPDELAMFPTPRIVHSHLLPKLLPDKAFKGKIVLVFRNPKDTAVSLYHFLQKERYTSNGLTLSWNSFIEQSMTDSSK